MVRAKRRRDQDAGPGERTHGPGRRPEGRDRHVPARDIEKTHADGRFEIGGVSRETIEAFSSRRAEIEAAMEGRGHGATAENQHLARRAALMTRAHKREVDREALRGIWEKQASELGLDSKALVASAAEQALHGLKKEGRGKRAGTFRPGRTPRRRPSSGRSPISRSAMRCSRGRIFSPQHSPTAPAPCPSGPSSGSSGTTRARAAFKMGLRSREATGSPPMWLPPGSARRSRSCVRARRTIAGKKGWRVAGLAPSASAVRRLEAESGIESETLQRFLERNAGLAQGRLTKGAARKMRAAFAKTVLVVHEGSLASIVQARDLLRIAGALRIPKLVLVGDATFARFPLTRSGTSTTVIPDCPGLVSSGNARMSDR